MADSSIDSSSQNGSFDAGCIRADASREILNQKLKEIPRRVTGWHRERCTSRYTKETRRNVFLREERIFFVQRKGCNNVPSLREPLTRRPVRSCPPRFVSKDNAPRETGLSRHGTRHRMTLGQLHARCRRVAAGCTVRYALIEESAGIYARLRVSRMPHARRCELIS